MLTLQPDLSLRRRDTGAAPGPDYSAEVNALLAGTPGWAIDPADATTLFTDTLGTVPVATPGVDTIGRINSKFGNTGYNWQSSVPQQPLWTGANLRYDGLDDLLGTTAFNAMNNAVAALFTARIKQDPFAGINRCIISLSTSVNTSVRFRLNLLNDGSLQLQLRRLDADAGQTFTTAIGLIVAGTAYTVQVAVNYLTGAVEIFIDGVSVFTGTYTAVDGINGVQNGSANRCRIGVNSTNTLNDYNDGDIGCMVMAVGAAAITPAARASCKGYVERNAI